MFVKNGIAMAGISMSEKQEEELKPYFSLENVRKGVFQVTEKLYGIQFKELNNVPKYHQDASVWEVTEANGTLVGVIYMDFFPRESKRGGAWMNSLHNGHPRFLGYITSSAAPLGALADLAERQRRPGARGGRR